ncbi:iron-containing alcohol dehydrogenase [Simiduia curdlanivorans]|uniref:Iron-containing alcohol dehydrogenase n=1 Tax=Simiduia curdlanivorans TaxID=1492769 RepID=A0ABV8V605_9GAMM|nr:iron-containing alcohol dehydrogenase [Simiduia curdlanivorans]MDN3638691.1 iron-containing alcohol dehydrogenase [Simiduia curdlanivorans]
MQSISFYTSPGIEMKPGLIADLGQFTQRLNAQSVLIISDASLVKLGLVNKAEAALQKTGTSYACFSDVQADPAEATVLAAVAKAKALNADVIIGLGGGSSMDVAKIVALLAHPQCQQTLADIYGVDKVTGLRLPLIQIPTTAGTGSEVTPIAIITTGSTTKAGIVSKKLLPDIALLDPELTLGLPPAITAATGIDAMVHAIEAFTSAHRKNPLSDILARQALALLSTHLLTAVNNGTNLEARAAMLLGACLAGQAFANAPVAAVHALAYPLGGHYHIPHGLSNALVLTAVLRFNASHAHLLYAQLADIFVANPAPDTEQACEQFINALDDLIQNTQLATRLRDLHISLDSLPLLAADAMLQQRLLVNNPKPMSEADALKIYQSIY